MDVNVTGMFLCTRAQSAAMVKQDIKPLSERGSRGVIVNMGSCSSFVATPNMGQYTSSKHAVLGLTRNAGQWVSYPRPLFISRLSQVWFVNANQSFLIS